MNSVQIVAHGAFGAAVAADLTTTLTSPATVAACAEPAELSVAAAIAVVAGRPVPAITGLVDEVSFNARVPWLPVIIESGVLRIGPMVVPGLSACYRCFRRRLLQHAASPAIELALDRHYRASIGDEPRGHLPGTVALATASTADVVERALVAPASAAGRVWQRDLPSGRMATGRAVGIHGCDRCGLHRAERNRSSSDLLRTMNEVLQWAR